MREPRVAPERRTNYNGRVTPHVNGPFYTGFMVTLGVICALILTNVILACVAVIVLKATGAWSE